MHHGLGFGLWSSTDMSERVRTRAANPYGCAHLNYTVKCLRARLDRLVLQNTFMIVEQDANV